jgi:hypothetical protein
MSSSTYEQMIKNAGAMRPILSKVVQALKPYAADSVVNPAVLAHQAGVSDLELLAAFNVLRTNGLGRLEVAVVNQRGQPIAFFPSADAITDTIVDEYGETWQADPSRLRVVFRPTPDGLTR